MSKHHLSAVLVSVSVVIILSILAFGKINKPAKPVPGSSVGFAVVELFTSEGCSSCPAADQAVARLLSKNTNNVFILCYHVDYWNRLGWKDPFSKAAYSQRQHQYAETFKLDGVYTPQIVVNGQSEFVGSDEQQLSRALQNNLSGAVMSGIHMDAKKVGNLLTVQYTIDANASGSPLLNIALLQPEATVAVKNGENGGRKLQHVNIVRELKTIEAAATGTVTMEIPGELAGMPLKLIAYTQEKKTLHILGVAQQSL